MDLSLGLSRQSWSQSPERGITNKVTKDDAFLLMLESNKLFSSEEEFVCNWDDDLDLTSDLDKSLYCT